MVYEFENDNIMLDSKKKVTAISRKMNVTVRKKNPKEFEYAKEKLG